MRKSQDDKKVSHWLPFIVFHDLTKSKLLSQSEGKMGACVSIHPYMVELELGNIRRNILETCTSYSDMLELN